MRKFYLLCVISMLMVGLMLSGCTQNQPPDEKSDVQDQQVYELNFQTDYMDKHPAVINAFKPWIEEVKELSNGRLIINLFNPNTLCPTKETYDSVEDGIIDMGAVPMGFTSGRFPLADIMQLPFIASNSEAGSLLLWEVYQTMPEWQEQFKDTKMLWQWTSVPVQVHTVDKPVRTLEDLKGMRLLAPQPKDIEIARLLGVNPIQVLPPDMYLSLQRNMAGGALLPMAPIRSLKISEVAKHHTMLNLRLTPFYAVMNMDKWNSLPDDLKKILEDTTGAKMAEATGKALDNGQAEDIEFLKKEGHTFIELVPEEEQKLMNAVDPLYAEAIEELEDKGYSNEKELFEKVQNMADKYSD